MTDQRKRGRPTLYTDRRRDARTSVSFTKDEFVRVYRAASDRNETVARFLRERVTESLRAAERADARRRA